MQMEILQKSLCLSVLLLSSCAFVQVDSQLKRQLLDKEAKLLLSEKGFDPVYGARPLARAIQENIKKPLADKILFGDLVNGGHIRITVKKGDFVFSVSQDIKVKEKVL